MASARPGRLTSDRGLAMTIVTTLLALLALIDGACSGFRSGVGRTGLVRHRASDVRDAWHGVALVALLLVPGAGVATVALAIGGHRADFVTAGSWMLRVLAPYVGAAVLALLAYGLLGWRQKYLAMALILGPLTLIRPIVVIAACVAGCVAASSWIVGIVITLSAGAVLSVEPLMNRRWRLAGTAFAF